MAGAEWLMVDGNDTEDNMFNFEKLETWQEAIAFADQLYELTFRNSLLDAQT